ncbi:hypothetical protein JZ751_007663, partial [Albula glossodonta]
MLMETCGEKEDRENGLTWVFNGGGAGSGLSTVLCSRVQAADVEGVTSQRHDITKAQGQLAIADKACTLAGQPLSKAPDDC